MVTTVDQLSKLVHSRFPVEPLPHHFFWTESDPPVGDIPEELARRFAQRPWVDVTLSDWTMMGHPHVARGYLEPTSFKYYLPSLLIGVLQDTRQIELALAAILPPGRNRRTTGKWWQGFAKSFSQRQRTAICGYLKGIRLLFWESIGPSNQQDILDAEAIWASLENETTSTRAD